MASHLSVSLSDSVQASLIIRHQEQRNQRSNQTGAQRDNAGDETEDSTSGLSLCVQCLLVMVFAGSEISITFTLIYSILFLEFVGVPTSLLSMGGVLCGLFNLIFLPVVGWLADRGSNSVIFKIKLMSISFGAFLIGYVGLALCSASRLYSFQNVLNRGNTTNTDIEHSNTTSQWNSSEHNSPDLGHQTKTDVISYISLISFGMIDIGFDSGVSLCRAFILECSPSAMHSRLLIMATVIASVAGVTFSIISTIDFPGILEPMFNVDGTAATVLMLSVFVLTFIVFSFGCTILSGYLLSRKKRAINDDKVTLPDVSDKHEELDCSTDTVYGMKSTKPLLSQNRHISYSSMSLNSQIQKRFNAPETPQLKRGLSSCENEGLVVHENDPDFFETHRLNQDDDESDDESLMSKPVSENEDNNDPSDEEENTNDDEDGHSTFMAAIRASNSLSLSWVQSSLLWDHEKRTTNKETRNTAGQNYEDSSSVHSLWKNKRLRILCVSLFFTGGSMLLFSIYSSNVLTIGIYHGDPTALPGTQGKKLYDKGLRNAALGCLMMYLAYAVISLLNKKIIDIIGEKVQFVLCQILLIAVLLMFLFLRNEELYYASSVASGFFRACTFTLGYVLANKFVQEEYAGTGSDPSKIAKSIGQTMVLIGFLLPSQYLLISALVGPLMNFTGNVWVTVIMGIVWTVVSVMVFSLLFIFKR